MDYLLFPLFNTEITCDPLETPANGTIIFIDNGAPANLMDSIVVFSCNEGYELVGDVSAVCLSTAQWSVKQPPQCVTADVDDGCEGEIPTTTAAVTTASKIEFLNQEFLIRF